MYRSAIYLLTCVLLHLICHLEGLRLKDFAGSLLVEVEEGRMGLERGVLLPAQLGIALSMCGGAVWRFLAGCRGTETGLGRHTPSI
jgi:hypothetical protein